MTTTYSDPQLSELRGHIDAMLEVVATGGWQIREHLEWEARQMVTRLSPDDAETCGAHRRAPCRSRPCHNPANGRPANSSNRPECSGDGLGDMSGLGALPARLLIDEAVRRFGAEELTRRLGLSSAGELLTLAVELDALRPPEMN